MKYNVQITAEYYRDYVIEADSKEEAGKQAVENFNYEETSDWDSIEVKVEEK